MARSPRPCSPVPRLALRTGEAAAACGVSEDFFAAEIAPHVPCVRRGRLKLYSVVALEEWLDENAELPFDSRHASISS
jgi:hypothetical protein